MGILIFLILLGVIIYFWTKKSTNTIDLGVVERRLLERNQEWISFINGYKIVAKTKAEKDVVGRMLADIKAQGLAPDTVKTPLVDSVMVADTAVTQPTQASTVAVDNASLLLYFGAFLFVASVGLFISFGGANGALKTFPVIITSLLLYCGGIWLFQNRSKQQQAGLAFVGIGMTIAPLAGLAIYYYLFGQMYGQAVWFITSLLCLGMYVHALITLHRPLISYILIFTFLSLFESSISLIQLPIYYFGWGMAVVGIILAVIGKLKHFWPELQEPSSVSSQLLLPVAVVTSTILVPTHGFAQLGVSLALAAGYYLLQTLNSTGEYQKTNAIVAHVSGLASIGCLAYAFGGNFAEVALSLGVVNVLQLLIFVNLSKQSGLRHNFASVTIVASVISCLFAYSEPALLYGLAGVITLSFATLAEYEKDGDWAVAAGLTACLPLLRAWDIPAHFLTSTLLALLLNIGLALRYRKDLNRWFSTGLWLLLPVPVGLVGGQVGASWSLVSYAWVYLLVAFGLMVSRAIARGVLFVSSKVPVASYAKNASVSYVFGYCFAATAAVILAVGGENSQIHLTAILGISMILIYATSRYIEKRAEGLALLPIFAQGFLWSAVRPIIGTDILNVYLLASSILAVAIYFVWKDKQRDLHDEQQYVLQAALYTAFAAPASVMIIGQTLLPMPIGLMLASALVYFHMRQTNQANREMAAALGVASVLWLMYYFGVRNLQAYTHFMAAILGLYAYWRHLRAEIKESDQYLIAMLAMATIPLAWQAIAGVAGGIYGWWLLLEQVGFMLLGTIIQKRKVTLFGLYVAVATVLYQLRHLGFAALAVLAIFVIAVAMYQLQKHPSDK